MLLGRITVDELYLGNNRPSVKQVQNQSIPFFNSGHLLVFCFFVFFFFISDWLVVTFSFMLQTENEIDQSLCMRAKRETTP